MRRISVITILVAFIVFLSSCSSSSPSPASAAQDEMTGTTESAESQGDAKSYGDVIEFDGLEIVFYREFLLDKVDNRFSEKNGAEVFMVPLTIKNVQNDTHRFNSLSYTQYGPDGLELDRVGNYFDDEIGSSGSMRAGASQDSYMAFLYNGDGDYYVEFSMGLREKIEVMLPIVKSEYQAWLAQRRIELAQMYATYIHAMDDKMLPPEAAKKHWYAVFSAPLSEIAKLDQTDFKKSADVTSFLFGYFGMSDANFLSCGWDINQWTMEKDLAFSTEWAFHMLFEIELMDGSVIKMNDGDTVNTVDGKMYFGDNEVFEIYDRNPITSLAYSTMIANFKNHFGTLESYTLGDLLFFTYRSFDESGLHNSVSLNPSVPQNPSPSAEAEAMKDNIGKMASVTAEVVNLRELSSTSSVIIKRLSPDDIFVITDADVDWYQVQLDDGTIGWVAAYLVTIK